MIKFLQHIQRLFDFLSKQRFIKDKRSILSFMCFPQKFHHLYKCIKHYDIFKIHNILSCPAVFIPPAEELLYQYIHVISISLSVAPCFILCTIYSNVSKSSASDEILQGFEPELLHCVVSGSFKFLKLKSLKVVLSCFLSAYGIPSNW